MKNQFNQKIFDSIKNILICYTGFDSSAQLDQIHYELPKFTEEFKKSFIEKIKKVFINYQEHEAKNDNFFSNSEECIQNVHYEIKELTALKNDFY